MWTSGYSGACVSMCLFVSMCLCFVPLFLMCLFASSCWSIKGCFTIPVAGTFVFVYSCAYVCMCLYVCAWSSTLMWLCIGIWEWFGTMTFQYTQAGNCGPYTFRIGLRQGELRAYIMKTHAHTRHSGTTPGSGSILMWAEVFTAYSYALQVCM